MAGSGTGFLQRAAIIAAALCAAPAAADLKAGMDAWSAGDYARAVTEWRPIANAGNGDAQFGMGQAYRLGRGVPVDPAIARSWFEKAAQQGHERAQTALGLLLFQSGDRKAAMHWLKKAADRGDPRGQYILGIAHYNGDGVARDWPRAYALMKQAAAQGMPAAAAALAEMDKQMSADDRERGTALAGQGTSNRKSPSAAFAGALKRAAGPSLKVETAATSDSNVTPSTPATVLRPAAPAVRIAAPAGRWRVQLGAYDSPAAARSQWNAIAGRIASLRALRPSYEPFGRFTRLRAGPLAGKSDADRLCAAARASGQDCFVVRP